jgi:hypothetical protein
LLSPPRRHAACCCAPSPRPWSQLRAVTGAHREG